MRVGEAETCGKEKGNLNAPTAQDAANSRAKNKAETKRSAQQSHPLRAIFGGGNVCDISLGRRDVSAGNAVEDAAEKKHPKRGRKTEDQKSDSSSDD